MNAQAALKGYNDIKIKAGVAGASPHGLIQMLFDGLLERMAQLKGAIEHNNIEMKHKKLNQSVTILSGLREALESKNGNTLADDLDALYDYVQRQLFSAQLKNSPEKIDECIALIAEVSGAWRKINPSLA